MQGINYRIVTHLQSMYLDFMLQSLTTKRLYNKYIEVSKDQILINFYTNYYIHDFTIGFSIISPCYFKILNIRIIFQAMCMILPILFIIDLFFSFVN